MTADPVGPKVVGRYRLIREIGRGSVGRVYEAHDPNIGRSVALKVLWTRSETPSEMEATFRERFLREARAAGRLNHRGIVTVHDADVDPDLDLAFIAMELVEGDSLARLLEGGKRIEADRACDVVAQVAEALAVAHAHGVVHRDVKPANILVTPGGEAKLTDFGVAKLVEMKATATGEVLGTPLYMSPEQVKAEPLDGRSDLFSLGVVLYECLTGRPPFRGETIAAIAHQICEVDPSESEPESGGGESGDGESGDGGDAEGGPGQGLTEVLRRALEKEPEARFASGEELAAAVRGGVAAIGGEAVESGVARAADPSPPFPGLRWSWSLAVKWVAIAAIVVSSLAAGVGLLPRTVPSTASERGTAESTARSWPFARQSARLVVLHENRLRSASMTIRIDGREVRVQELAARGGLFARAQGQLVRLDLPVAPGRRSIEVSIRGAKGNVDAADVTSGEFTADETRHLRVKFLPLVERVSLEWES